MAAKKTTAKSKKEEEKKTKVSKPKSGGDSKKSSSRKTSPSKKASASKSAKKTPKKTEAKKKEAPSPSVEEVKKNVNSAVSSATEKISESVNDLEQKIDNYGKGKGFNFGSLFLGIVLIAFGIGFLARNLGWIDFDQSFHLWQLWPIFIIFAGLSMMRARGWLSTLLGSFLTVILIALVGLMLFFGNNDLQEESFDIEREQGIEEATVRIESGAGKLDIEGGAEKLLEGKFESASINLAKNSEVEDGKQKISLEVESVWHGFFTQKGNALDLKLNQDVPLSVFLKSGAADLALDFRELNLRELDIDTGASSLELKLGDQVYNLKVRIEAGASSIDITLPETVGAEIDLDAGLTSKDLDGFEKKEDGIYKSLNYDSADKIIKIELDLGVSSLNVDWE